MREGTKPLNKWEQHLGHKYVWEAEERMIERNRSRVIDLECRYEGCGKVCKWKGGWYIQHQKRVNQASLEKVRFESVRCGLVRKTEVVRERLREGGK